MHSEMPQSPHPTPVLSATETHRRSLVAATASLLLALALPAPAKQPALVVDAASGTVLHHEQMHRRWYPASLVKLMTLYLTFEAIEAGRLPLDASLDISAEAVRQPPVKLGLRAGQTLNAADAVAAVATVSANDAAAVLAERLAGSETAFAARMTEKAQQLGMNRTVFRNATGLPDSGQYTTARDMTVLAMRLLQDFPEHYDVFASRSFTHAGRRRGAHNALLGVYSGADGVKTGFTCASGYNLVASAERDGRRLIGVVLGGGTRGERDRRMIRLFDAAFRDGQAASGHEGLEALAPLPDLQNASPPNRLSKAACARVAGRSYRPDRLSGWGLLFGVFPERRAARDAVKRARKALDGIVPEGTPVYLKRKFQHGTSWKTLLVGFKQADAGRACKHLWGKGFTCAPQTPQRMNHPHYAKR